MRAIAVITVLSLSGACLALSCAKPANPGLYQRLQDDDPSVRLSAIVEAGQTKDKAAVGLLVDRLNESDGDMRLMSFVALQRITGQTMGYHYYDPPEVRQEAIQRWRQWLKDHKSFPTPTTQSAAVATGGTPP